MQTNATTTESAPHYAGLAKPSPQLPAAMILAYPGVSKTTPECDLTP